MNNSIKESSVEELQRKLKNLKTAKIVDAVLIGFTVGIFIYGAVTEGLSFFTFFPLILGYFFFKNSKNNELLKNEIEKELKSREHGF